MDTVYAGVHVPSHPIDPLAPAEVAAAATIVRMTHNLGAGIRFETICAA